jgi:hypothetical protein
MILKHSPSLWKKIGNLLYPTVDSGIVVGGTEAGQSKIASGLVVNESGGNTDADDFRAETSLNANAFVVDASANKVLVGVEQVNTASLSLPYLAITAVRTLDATDYTVNCTANTFTVTLPTAVGIQGRIYNIKNTGTGVITVDGAGSETIDGNLTITLSQYDNLTIQSTNAGWIII